MRPGPNYSQWVDRSDKGDPSLSLPLELVNEWEGMDTVVWRDNGDGSYTLFPANSGDTK